MTGVEDFVQAAVIQINDMAERLRKVKPITWSDFFCSELGELDSDNTYSIISLNPRLVKYIERDITCVNQCSSFTDKTDHLPFGRRTSEFL